MAFKQGFQLLAEPTFNEVKGPNRGLPSDRLSRPRGVVGSRRLLFQGRGGEGVPQENNGQANNYALHLNDASGFRKGGDTVAHTEAEKIREGDFWLKSLRKLRFHCGSEGHKSSGKLLCGARRAARTPLERKGTQNLQKCSANLKKSPTS